MRKDTQYKKNLKNGSNPSARCALKWLLLDIDQEEVKKHIPPPHW